VEGKRRCVACGGRVDRVRLPLLIPLAEAWHSWRLLSTWLWHVATWPAYLEDQKITKQQLLCSSMLKAIFTNETSEPFAQISHKFKLLIAA
jgi:hypothetical protein